MKCVHMAWSICGDLFFSYCDSYGVYVGLLLLPGLDTDGKRSYELRITVGASIGSRL